MSKLLKNFVGIDISKEYFDAALVKSESPSQIVHEQFPQKAKGYLQMIQWLQQQGVLLNEETLVCMEDTGIYNIGLVTFLSQLPGAQIWVEMPLRIKKTGGFERGSNDKTASIKIAWYAFRYQDKIKLWQPLQQSLQKIKILISQRDRIKNAINQLRVPVNELKHCGCIPEAKLMEKLQRESIVKLKKAKSEIEALILKTVKEDELLYEKIKLVQSVKGIGPVTAVAMLVYTKGFTSFSTPKELACYCGVVPFAKTSGTSVRYKSSVSPYANKKLKTLMHLCALSAIKNDIELKMYFNRKVTEGKNKMCVINAVRNKLVHRMFAVIRDNRPFEVNYVRKCA